MAGVLLVIVAVVVPLAALLHERAGTVRMSERHHSHHDTYVVPASFTRSITIAMLFMSALGLVLALFCRLHVLHAQPLAVLGFCDAFVVTCFVMQWALCRYRVSTFRDCMAVTPFLGHEVWVRYDQIDRLVWSGLRMESGFRTLDVWVGGRRAVRLRGIVDVEQIIMSVDRFDLLPRTTE
ncbi:hypothetical protein [Olsenella profusa]|uniref:PH domain-containing protein n=1 Tax=Olsenella profusa TaxID=138595 RepID=A0ABS2F020_9ACTN|nr:hypothetical protein [Olsenella profusa]MBM6774321.1 hypothetical protein [Olsenella profusa]